MPSSFLTNDPELIRTVLITNDRRFSKGPGLRVAERLLGQSLLTSQGEYHRRQRRLAQPAFHRSRLGGYGQVMADYSLQWQRSWADGAVLDLAQEMRGLTLRIAAKTLFDTEVAAEIQEISEALTESLRLYVGGRPAQMEDLPRLPYTRMVFSEAMRCYPPAWIIARRALEDCPLGTFTLPADALVLMSPWVTHHDPRHYPDPFRFDPQRWTVEAAANRPRFAYYPFGGGSRVCIGEQFAWMEGVLVLATLASLWQFGLVRGHHVVAMPSITLRPKYGVRMLARRRPGPSRHE